jgi:hypothetical protein
MYTLEDILKWITLFSAFIAALASSWSLWVKYRENEDSIKVVFWPLNPSTEPGYWLHVVSCSNHLMNLKDYGFIDESGQLLSLPFLLSDEPDLTENIFARGKSSFNQRGELFEIGIGNLRDKQIG